MLDCAQSSSSPKVGAARYLTQLKRVCFSFLTHIRVATRQIPYAGLTTWNNNERMGLTMKRISTVLALSTAIATVAGGAAYAQSAGDWTLGIGLGYLNPKSDNGTVNGAAATIDSDVRPIFTAEYFIWDNVGIELLAATQFKHEISLDGNAAATTKHLPPTLSINYHFDTGSKWSPYAGIGLNYTAFSDEKLIGNAASIELDDSWGVAVQAGVDYQISEKGAVRLNVRWFDIDTDVTIGGNAAGTAEIDPILVGMSYVHKF